MSADMQTCPTNLEFMEPLTGNKSEIDNSAFSYLLQLQLGCVFVFIRDVLEIVAKPETRRPGMLGLLMMRTPTGEMVPAHLPNIGDMCGRENVSLLRMRLSKIADECPMVHRLPPELHHLYQQIIDPKPVFKVDLPVYELQNESKVVKVGAFTDALCVIAVAAKTSIIGVTVENGADTQDPFKRWHKLKLSPGVDGRLSDINIGEKVVIWNARGLSCPSFEKNLGKILEGYDPCAVVITEARVSTLAMMKIWVTKGLEMEWSLDDSQCLDGGVAFLWRKNRASVQFTAAPPGVGTRRLIGQIKGGHLGENAGMNAEG